MSLRARMAISDLLFGGQIAGALLLCAVQFLRLIETTQGQLLSMYVCIEAYLCFNLMLALDAHRVRSGRVIRQALWTYVIWLVLIAFDIAAFVINGSYQWNENDTRTAIFVTLGVVLICVATNSRNIGLEDPMIKSLLAMLFKALPQFAVAVEIEQEGGHGVPGLAIIVGNLTILIRIGQILFAACETGWNRNLAWLCASETVNEVSWAVVSIVWLIWHLTP